MRRFTGPVAIAVAAALALLALAASAPAGAAVATKNTKFCKAVANSGNNVSSGVDQSNIKNAAKAINKAANAAPAKVKAALKYIASKFTAIANAKGATAQSKAALALQNDSKYRKAAQTFGNYYTKNCAPTTPPTT
jgi:hypothetical protein